MNAGGLAYGNTIDYFRAYARKRNANFYLQGTTISETCAASKWFIKEKAETTINSAAWEIVNDRASVRLNFLQIFKSIKSVKCLLVTEFFFFASE